MEQVSQQVSKKRKSDDVEMDMTEAKRKRYDVEIDKGDVKRKHDDVEKNEKKIKRKRVDVEIDEKEVKKKCGNVENVEEILPINNTNRTDEVKIIAKLSDYDIDLCNSHCVVAIKKELAHIINVPEKKIRLFLRGGAMDDNTFFKTNDDNEISVGLVSEAEGNSYIVIKVVSLDAAVPEFIQVKKTAMFSEVSKILFGEGSVPHYQFLKDADETDAIEIRVGETVEQNGLVDNAPIYIYYGDVTLKVKNPTGEDEPAYVTITTKKKGSDLKQEVSSNVSNIPESIVLLVTNDRNTKFEVIEDNQLLFKYGITENSIIKWIEVQKLDNIDIDYNPLNKHGTFVDVFKAVNRSNNKCFALKKYNMDFGTNPSELLLRSKEFGNELINSWKLRVSRKSDRIVEMFGIYGNGPIFYFAMELMKKSLRDVVDTEGFLGDTDVKKYTRQIIEGLIFLHDLNIIHRNLKCSSVLLDKNRNIKLCSFGFSKYLVGPPCSDILNGQRGSQPIDFHWTSPETVKCAKWSVYTDVWSLGATVVEMRTGKKPYHDVDKNRVASLIVKDSKLVYDKPKMDEEIFEIFDGFISCCTKKTPKERWIPEKLLGHEYLNGSRF